MEINFYPCNDTSGLINVIWEQKSDEPCRWQILPSGYVELIFRLGSRFKVDTDKSRVQSLNPTQQFCFLSGLHTKPIYLTYEKFHCIGIQLKPPAVKALFNIPTCELRNNSLDGELIFSELPLLEDTLNSSQSFWEKARFLEQFILSKIYETADLHQSIKLATMMDNLTQQKILGEKVDIQSQVGYSRTHTYRIFNEWFGHSSSNILKLYQFAHAIKQLHILTNKLTTPAFKSGYFDQSHFIRSFKEFASMTPGKYQRRRTHIPGQLTY